MEMVERICNNYNQKWLNKVPSSVMKGQVYANVSEAVQFLDATLRHC